MRAAFRFSLFALVLTARASCFAPDHTERPATKSPTALSYWAPKLSAVGSMLKKNGALLGIEDTRLRINTFVGYHPPVGGGLATIRATLYPRNTWVGACELIAGPEFFNSGSVAITFNQVQDIFRDSQVALRFGDEKVFIEPKLKERIGNVVLYDSNRIVLLSGGVAPWVYVTTEEHLAQQRREKEERVRQAEEALRQVEEMKFDVARANAAVAALEKTDPKAAANLRALNSQTQKQLEQSRQQAMPGAERQLAAARQELAQFDASSRAISAEARKSPAQVAGRGPLVKLNPVLSDANFLRKRAYIVTVFPIVNDRKYLPVLLDAMRQVDYTALSRMLE